MKPTQPKTDTPSCMEELLEPALVMVLEEHGVVFGLDAAKKVVRAAVAITCRYLFHAGGSPVLAIEQFIRRLRLAQRKHAKVEAFAATTLPEAKA